MFDVPSSVVERLVYQQDELTTVFGDLRFSVDHSGAILGVTYCLVRHARHWDRGFGGFGASKYLIHNCRGIPTNEAIGRHIFQNHRTCGNNRTLANRYSRENQAAHCNPASRAKENGRNLELEI